MLKPNGMCSEQGVFYDDGFVASLPRLAVPVGDRDHVIGYPDAAVTLVQYGDYECASCFDAEPIVKSLLRRHGRRLRFVFRHFPHSSVHPQASLAAQAAEAAGAQGQFWEMHELLFRQRNNLGELEMTHLALNIGLEIYRFDADLANGAHVARVRADFVGGAQSGVSHTPAFFVNGARVIGLGSIEALSTSVELALQCNA